MLWAHDFHIYAAQQSGPGTGNVPYTTQGTLLRRALGGSYIAVGQEFDRGSFATYEFRPTAHRGLRVEPFAPVTVGSAEEGSLNDALASADAPLYVVDIRHASADPVVGSWWSAPHAERTFGTQFLRVAKSIFESNIVAPAGYDLLVEQDVVTAAPQLPCDPTVESC